MRRESELAAGHGEVRLAGFVTVSGRGEEDLRRACSEVLDQAARARLELHPAAVPRAAMSTPFITYLWHYLAARAIYDELVRPLTHGHAASLLLLMVIAAGAFLLGRQSRLRNRR